MADSRDRPKKSWRERDAQKDRSSQPRREEGNRAEPGARSSKQYRAALEALFDKGGVAKVAEKLAPPPVAGPPKARVTAPNEDEGKLALRKKLVEAIGRDEVTRAADRYLKEYPLPADFEVLEQVIEHRKSDRIAEALAAIDALLAREKPKRTRILIAKLRMLEETADDKEIREAATRLRAKLG